MFDPLRGRTVGIGALPGGGKHPRLTSVVRPPACLLCAVLWGEGVRTSGTRLSELHLSGGGKHPRLTSIVRPPACPLRAVLWGEGVRTSGTRVLELQCPGVTSTPG